MPMKPEDAARARVATRAAAASFVEDLGHIRDVLSKPNLERGEVRRMSAILRRFVVDGDLPMIAAPRLGGGRLKFMVPDNNAFYRAQERARVNYSFFVSGGVGLFGLECRAALAVPGEFKDFPIDPLTIDSDARVELNIDSFLSQRIICVEGRWISRKLAIKHIANYASGVHSRTPDNPEEELAARARCYLSFGINDKAVANISVNVQALGGDVIEPDFDPNHIDCVLYEVFCSASFVVNSPSVIALEAEIQANG